MIYDQLANAYLYAGVSQSLAKAFEILGDKNLIHGANGRYDIDGDNLFCLVQRYTSKPAEKCNFEAHRKYIDVQLVVSGEEAILHDHPAHLEVTDPYDEGTDKALYQPHPRMNRVRLAEGNFCVFFPHDAHMPCLQAEGPSEVHKVVIKVRV